MVSKVLFQFQTARDQVRLVANAQELVSQTCKAQHVHGAAIALKVISSTSHWLAGLCVFVGQRHTRKPPRERIVLTINKAGKESSSLILVATSEILNRDSFFDRFLANPQIAVIAIAINKFRVLVDFVRL